MKHLSGGVFITMEGTDGAGKSTQVKLLRDFLVEQGWDVVVTREPGGTYVGEKIREILVDCASGELTPLTELFLYLAGRHQHTQQLIKPALEAGKVVICDRYADSSLVYQGFGRGIPQAVVEELNRLATEGITPDITFLFLLPWREGQRRLKRYDRLESAGDAFFRRVEEGYKRLAKLYPDRILTVDATLCIEDIHRMIRDAVVKLLDVKRRA